MHLLILSETAWQRTFRGQLAHKDVSQRLQSSFGVVVSTDVCWEGRIHGKIVWRADRDDYQWLLPLIGTSHKLAYGGYVLGKTVLVKVSIGISSDHNDGACSIDQILMHWAQSIRSI